MSTRQPNSATVRPVQLPPSLQRRACAWSARPMPLHSTVFARLLPVTVHCLLSRSGSKRFVSEVNVGSGVYAVALAESVGEPSVDAWIKAGSSISAALEVRLHWDDARFLTFPAMCVARTTMHVACSTIHARLRLPSCS